MARDARETVKLVQERVLVGLSSYRARGWRWEANCQSDNCFHWSGTSVEYVPHPATISEGWSHESWKGGGFWRRATGHRVRLTGYIFRHEYILSWLQVGYGQTGIAPLSTRKTSQVLFFSFSLSSPTSEQQWPDWGRSWRASWNSTFSFGRRPRAQMSESYFGKLRSGCHLGWWMFDWPKSRHDFTLQLWRSWP